MRSLVVIAEDVAVARRIRPALRHAAALRLSATIDPRGDAADAIARHAPDVVLVADTCQRVNTLRRLRDARRGAPDATVLLLAAPGCGGPPDDAFRAGADGIVSSAAEAPVLGALLGLIGLGDLALPARRPEPAHPVDAGPPALRVIGGAQDARGTRAKA